MKSKNSVKNEGENGIKMNGGIGKRVNLRDKSYKKK